MVADEHAVNIIVVNLVLLDRVFLCVLGSKPDEVDATALVARIEGRVSELVGPSALVRGGHVVQLLHVSGGGKSLVGIAVGVGVEIAGQRDTERSVSGLNSLDLGHNHLDTLGTGFAADIIQVGIGMNELLPGRDVLKDGNSDDASASGTPSVRDLVRGGGQPLHLAVNQLQGVGAVEDRAVLAGLLSVVSADADVGPPGAEAALDVVQLVIEDLLQADNSHRIGRRCGRGVLEGVDDMRLAAAGFPDGAEEIPPRLLAGFTGAGVVADVEGDDADGETLSDRRFGQEERGQDGLELHYDDDEERLIRFENERPGGEHTQSQTPHWSPTPPIYAGEERDLVTLMSCLITIAKGNAEDPSAQ